MLCRLDGRAVGGEAGLGRAGGGAVTALRAADPSAESSGPRTCTQTLHPVLLLLLNPKKAHVQKRVAEHYDCQSNHVHTNRAPEQELGWRVGSSECMQAGWQVADTAGALGVATMPSHNAVANANSEGSVASSKLALGADARTVPEEDKTDRHHRTSKTQSKTSAKRLGKSQRKHGQTLTSK